MTERSYTPIPDLIGATLTAVDGCALGSERITFTLADGSSVVFFHDQDCCESVRVDDVTGDPADLVGSPLLMAEVATLSDNDPGAQQERVDSDSWTWSFYKFATAKGYVTVRWLGASNGYYSEGVSVVRLTGPSDDPAVDGRHITPSAARRYGWEDDE